MEDQEIRRNVLESGMLSSEQAILHDAESLQHAWEQEV